MTKSARFLLLALAVGVLIRAALVVLAVSNPAILHHSDQMTYLELGKGMLEHWDFGLWWGAERMPVYPTFLALCQLLSGQGLADGALSAKALNVALIIQHMLGLATVYVLYRCGRLVNQRTANLCAAFAALDLNMTVYATQILTEALFIPIMALVLYAFMLYRETGGPVRLGVLAALLGLATLTRSVTMYIPLFILPFLLVEWDHGGLVPRLRRMALFCIVFLLFVGPWSVRNVYLYGHWDLTNQGGAHIAGWVIPSIAQYEEGMSFEQGRQKYVPLWYERQEAMPEAERKDHFAVQDMTKAWFKDYVREANPLSVGKAWFWGAVKNVFAPISAEAAYIFQMDWTRFSETEGSSFPEQAWNFMVHNKNKAYSVLLVGGLVLTLAFRLLQCVGLFALVRERPGVVAVGLLLTAYILAVNGPIGYAKYRLPFEPFLILLSAMGAGVLPSFRGEMEGP